MDYILKILHLLIGGLQSGGMGFNAQFWSCDN